MTVWRVVSFFGMFPPAHPISTIGLAMTAVFGPVLIVFGLATPAAVFVPLILLQALASSSGVAGPTRRGHYDLLLTLGHSRLQLGVVHWCMSARWGVGVWLLLIATERLVTRRQPVLADAGAAGLMLLASTCPWALTIALPRLSGGVALGVAASFLFAVISAATRSGVVAAVTSAGWVGFGVALLVGAASITVALRHVMSLDVPLEAAQ